VNRYATAIGASLLAVILTRLAAPVVSPSAALFYAVVVVVAWHGGRGPGIAAALASAFGLIIALSHPSWSLMGGSPADWLHGVVLLGTAALTGTLADGRAKATAEAEAAVRSSTEAASALRLETLRNEAILESVSDGILVQDPEGRIVYANSDALRMFGFGAHEAPPGVLRELWATLEPTDEDGRPVRLDALPGYRALQGEEAPERVVRCFPGGQNQGVWVSIRSRPIRDDAGRVVLAVSALHDLTARIRHEHALQSSAYDLHRLTTRLEVTVEQLRVEREDALSARAQAVEALERIVTLQSVTAALSEAQTPPQVASAVIERGMAALGARSGALLSFDGGDTLKVVGAGGMPLDRIERWVRAHSADLAVIANVLRLDALPAGEGSFRRDQSALVADALGQALETEALALVPVIASGRSLGVLAFDLRERGPLSPEGKDLLLALGRQCAQALDRAILFAAARRAQDAAEQASRAKSQFLAVMSHELRTPLNAILGYEELLEIEVAGPLNSVQKHHLSRIRESTRHLLTLIEQILTLSRVQSGDEVVHIKEVDALDLAREAAALMEPHVVRKGLRLETGFPDGALRLNTDPRKVRQILLNLLSNAVKFTETGTVRFTLTRADGAVFFRVRDTGSGIEERDREYVFEPFAQLRSEGRLTSGTGLGLPVARELARHLGGDLTLDSRPGDGSLFTLRVPITAVDGARSVEAAQSASAPAPSPTQVLPQVTAAPEDQRPEASPGAQ